MKLALEQSAMPAVQLHKDAAGVTDKAHMYYDVKWTGIADENSEGIMDHLAGYPVTI